MGRLINGAARITGSREIHLEHLYILRSYPTSETENHKKFAIIINIRCVVSLWYVCKRKRHCFRRHCGHRPVVDDTSRLLAAAVQDPFRVRAYPSGGGGACARVAAERFAGARARARARVLQAHDDDAHSQFNELCAQVQRSPPHTRPTTSASTLYSCVRRTTSPRHQHFSKRDIFASFTYTFFEQPLPFFWVRFFGGGGLKSVTRL